MKGIYIKSTTGGYISTASLSANVEGAFISYPWASLQGQDGKLTTGNFYTVCKRALDHGKKLLISITTGNVCSSYLFYNGVEKVKFVEYRRRGDGPRFTTWIADVNNGFYKTAWIDFLNKFFQWIRGTDLWDGISGFKTTGLTFTTEELRLPYQTPEMMGDPQVTDSIAIWQRLGYKEEDILEFWNSIYSHYEMWCEDKWINLSVLGGQAFPCINESGVYAYTGVNNFTKKMIKPGCAINSTALTTTGGTPSFIKGDKAGFQMAFVNYAANQVIPSEFEAMLRNGINHGGKWLEIADYNISGPGNYKTIIETINSEMV